MLAQGAQQKKSAVRLYDVADHLHPAVLSGGGESVNCALEAIECVRVTTGHTYLKRPVEKVPEKDPDVIADDILAVVHRITVAALTDPERYPPIRQLALLRRALVRLKLPAETSEDELA
jgi:hypothetical protein